MQKKNEEQYEEEETQERFDAMLKGALKSPPKPLKDIKATKPNRKINRTSTTKTKQKIIK